MFKKRIAFGFGVVAMLLLIANLALAQASGTSSGSTTAEPTVDDINKQKALVDAQRLLIESQQSLLKSSLGLNVTPTATAPTGKIEGDKDKFIEVQLLAKTAAQQAANKLAKQLCDGGLDPKPKAIVFGKSMDLTEVQSYRVIVRQTNSFATMYGNQLISLKNTDEEAGKKVKAAENLLATGSPGAQQNFGLFEPVTLGTTGVRLVADLINLFRTTTEFKGQTISGVDETTIAAFLLDGTSSCKNTAIYFPSIYRPTGGTMATKSSLLEAIEKLQKSKDDGEIAVLSAKSRLARIDSVLKDIQDKTTSLNAQPQTRDRDIQIELLKEATRGLVSSKAKLDLQRQNMESLQTALTAFLGSLPVVDAASKLTMIASLLRAEALATLLDQKDTYVLDLSVTASGTTRIRQNIFWNAKPDHTGGVTIIARVFDFEGRMVGGYSADHYYDYTSSGDIRRTLKFASLTDSASAQTSGKDDGKRQAKKKADEKAKDAKTTAEQRVN